jgi:hypothetical protein
LINKKLLSGLTSPAIFRPSRVEAKHCVWGRNAAGFGAKEVNPRTASVCFLKKTVYCLSDAKTAVRLGIDLLVDYRPEELMGEKDDGLCDGDGQIWIKKSSLAAATNVTRHELYPGFDRSIKEKIWILC